MPTDPWRLDPAKFPKRLDLDLSEEVYARLLVISQRTGRSISEIATEILGQAIDPSPPGSDLPPEGI